MLKTKKISRKKSSKGKSRGIFGRIKIDDIYNLFNLFMPQSINFSNN